MSSTPKGDASQTSATGKGKDEYEAQEGAELCDFDINICNEDLVDIYHDLLVDARCRFGIKYFVVPGSNLVDSASSLAISKTYTDRREADKKAASTPSSPSNDVHILSTCGVHPYHAPLAPLDTDRLQELDSMVRDSACLAVGECGLDYSTGIVADIKRLLQEKIDLRGSENEMFATTSDITDAKIFNIQKEWFKKQIDLALKYDKPLYLHIREAHSDFLDIMSSYPQLTTPLSLSSDASLHSSVSLHTSSSSIATEPPFLPKAVVHCFTGSTEELRQYLDMGFLIGLTGHIYRLKDRELKTWLDMITLNRLVLETDAPWMGFKKCKSLCNLHSTSKAPANVPSALVLIVDRVHKVSGWSKGDIAAATTRNALRFLRYI
jgi:TatD DNase family protein